MKRWNVNYSLFKDDSLNEEASLVVEDIVDHFLRMIPKGPPLGYKHIKLINDKVAGPTLYWPLGADIYKIGLNVSEVHYNQIAFQFAQEFTKLYCDPRIYNWFVEIISHVAAIYILEYLSVKWEHNPPKDQLIDYWSEFDSYRSNLLGAAFSKVDIVKYQVSNEWVPYQVNKLRKVNHTNRGKLLIIAYELLPLFKEYPEGWELLPYIGKNSKPAPPEDPKNLITNRKAVPDFDRLLEVVPKKIKPFLEKLYDKFGVSQFT